MIEKRKHQRLNYYTEVEWEMQNTKFSGKIADISISGAYIDTLIPLPDNSIILLTFRLPSEEEFKINAIVKTSIDGMGMGIEFINMSGEKRRELSSFIEKGVASSKSQL